MNRSPRVLAAFTALVLLPVAAAQAATEDQARVTAMKEAECAAARRAVPSASGGGFAMSNGEPTVLQPMNRPNARQQVSARARRRTVCGDAERLREALEGEVRPAATREAVWAAVFEPLEWSARTTGLNREASRRANPSALTQRYTEAADDLLRGHPPSEKQNLSALAAAAVEEYKLRRRELIVERICGQRDSFDTSEALGEALNEIDALAEPEKERLIEGVWEAVGPTLAAKLTEYATAAQPTVQEARPDFFSGWSTENVAATVNTLCGLSQYRR